MAEALGVISGAFGIGAFAVQIIESVQKLRWCLSSFIHAQSHLLALLKELESLAALISVSNDTRPSGSVPVDNRSDSAIDCCKTAAEIVCGVLSDIERVLNRRKTHKTLFKIGFVLKEKEIGNNLQKLERAKSMLILAYQLQMHKMLQENTIEISKLRCLLNPKPTQAVLTVQKLDETEARQIHGFRRTRQSMYSLLIGTFLVAFARNGSEIAQARARFSPATWLALSWGFEVILSRCFGKPQFHFRAFNIVHQDSPARVACAHGNKDELYRLFHEGLATPYDVTPEGSTLLHAAAASHEADICKMLLDYGADVCAVNMLKLGPLDIKWTPLMTAISTMYSACNRPPFYPEDEARNYEMATIRGIAELKTDAYEASSLSATAKVLKDHVHHNYLDFAPEVLPISSNNSLGLIPSAGYDLEILELYSEANHRCHCSQWERNNKSFLSGLELYEKAFSLLKSRHSAELLALNLVVLLSQVMPKLQSAIWFKRLIPDTTSLERILCILQNVVSTSILRTYQNSMKSWDRWRRWNPFSGNRIDMCVGTDLLWLIIYSTLRNVVKTEDYEINTNLAIESWLSLLENTDVDLREHLEREKQFYLLMPYWLRTNFVRIHHPYSMELLGSDEYDFHFTDPDDLYDPSTKNFKPVIGKFDLCEIALDFVLDEPGDKLSVSMRLIPIDVERWVAEVRSLRSKQNIPGQWVE